MKFRQLGVIAVLIFVVAGMSFIDVPKRTTSASGSSYHNIIGWAWSDNIGWLSFGCDNEGTCAGVNYGVDMAQDGELSGYAWSDNIGWVVFNRNDLNGCPSSPCKAKVIPGTGEMTGWAKALSADGNGWDGWISLSGSGSYTQTTGITATGGTITTVGGDKVHTFTSSGTFTVTSGNGNVEVLVVGGGGGAGGDDSGGGGGGGLVYNSSYAVTEGGATTVTVGAGGPGTVTGPSYGTNGNNSVFGSITAIGGGAGAGRARNGKDGGSGGGGGGSSFQTGGAGTTGQGNNGGSSDPNYLPRAAGGGGGAGAVGGNATSATRAGNGGAGLQYSISGTSKYYAGGGGGGAEGSGTTAGTGGSGGGGAGTTSGTGTSGTANTGGGGGGASQYQDGGGGSGGSGIVIVRYLGSSSTSIPYNYGPLLNALDPAKQFFEGYAWGSDVVGWLRFDARTDYEVRLSGQVCNNNSVCEAGLGENIASCSADCATADFSLQETGNLFIKTVSGNGAFSGKVVISVVPTGGFSEDISLSAYSVSPAIPGAVYKFNTTSCALGEICAILNSSAYASGAEFSISVPAGTGEGVYTITITGVAGGLTRTANISLTVGSIDPGYKEF